MCIAGPCAVENQEMLNKIARQVRDGGATVLDASVGGLGGCPFSPDATGHIATEDLVWQFERDGVETGIDMDSLIEVSRWLEQLLGRPLEGQVYRAARWP